MTRPASRNAWHPSLTGRVPRGLSAVAALAVVLSGCAGVADEPPAAGLKPPATATAATAAPSATPAPATSADAPPAGVAPTSVSIPAIDLDEQLIDLGIASDGSMEVPTDYSEVGWFTGGGRPGGRGPTVIAAHVDSPTGGAVFGRLRELQVGDTVDIVDAAGATHRYVVTETADYAKAAFPTAAVFGATPNDELRLITCGGFFDRDAGSYVENRVVFAAPA